MDDGGTNDTDDDGSVNFGVEENEEEVAEEEEGRFKDDEIVD
jgi:hypothetical protein